jgi:hypothetical protein
LYCARRRAAPTASADSKTTCQGSTAPPPPCPPLDAAAAAATVTLALADGDVPVALTQLNVYVNVPAALPVTVIVPLVACVPLQLPDATQLVALAELHVKVVEAPTRIDVLAAFKVGAGGAAAGSRANAALA